MGTVALNSLLHAEERREGEGNGRRGPHHVARAKNCIFLYLEGGPSHLDTFDPKPKLEELDGQFFQREGRLLSAMASGKRRYVKSPFGFRQAGQSGHWICDRFEHLAGVADEMCIYRGGQAESIKMVNESYEYIYIDRHMHV